MSRAHPALNSLSTMGLKGSSASRAHPGLNSLGAMQLKGTCASRAHPAWTPWMQQAGEQVEALLEEPTG